MGEKAYKTMTGAGALAIAVGVITLVVGITSGILLIVGGSKLFKNRHFITF